MVESLSANHRIKVQIGYSDFESNQMELFDFCTRQQMLVYMREADVIISHGGYGTIIDSLVLKKKVIVVPRSSRLGESKDNQSELASYFEAQGLVLVANNSIELVGCMDKVCLWSPAARDDNNTNSVSESIKDTLKNILG